MISGDNHEDPIGGPIPRRAPSGYTATVRRAIRQAELEAATLGDDHVGADHLLLGLLTEDGAVAMAVFERAGINRDALRQKLVGVRQSNKPHLNSGERVPYSARAKKVLENSMSAIADLDESWIGTGHLLLGVLHDGTGNVAHILSEGGVTRERARAEALLVLKAKESMVSEVSEHREGTSGS